MTNKKKMNDPNIINNFEINENKNLVDFFENKLKKSVEKIQKITLEQNQKILKIKNRIANEIEKNQKFSLEKLIIEFLSIIDNIERAFSLIQAKKDSKYIEILKKIEDVLSLVQIIFSEFKISKINDTKVEFNPNIHQAISIRNTNKIESNQVLEIMQSGYMICDSRLLRPAMVIVSQK